jgi:hypothetical protein
MMAQVAPPGRKLFIVSRADANPSWLPDKEIP